MWQTVIKGGPVMAPIILCSFIALAIIIERAVFFYSHKFPWNAEWPSLEKLLDAKRLEDAMQFITRVGGLGSETLLAAVSSAGETKEIVAARMQKSAKAELLCMEKGLYWLEVIVTIAPLLGLLGTVTGIINCFNVLNLAMANDPNILSAGIAEALITTATGLIVAIPSYVFFSYYQNIINRRVAKLNSLGEEVLKLTAGDGR
ncbi:MAG: MotA/TolQ/ExbB proton channel family protein [Bacillota bacterium]